MIKNTTVSRLILALLLLTALSVPYSAHAAEVEINGTMQINNPGTGIVFPDASVLGGTEGIKFIIATVGLFVGPFTNTTYSDRFVGEIRMFAGNYAPPGWAFCDGQLLSIASNSALFSILGTTYGGNGSTTFALPNLNNRAPVGY